ncbi:MAG: DUF5719 family protein [Rhodoglobus sp.]
MSDPTISGPTPPEEPTSAAPDASASDAPTVPEITPEPEGIFEDDSYLEPEKPKATLKGAAIVGVRLVAGVVGIGVAGVVIAAATFVPLPGIHSTPSGLVVTPVATGQQLVCAGSLLRLADDTGQGATTSSALGRASVRFDASAGAVDTSPLATSDAGNGGDASAPAVLATPPNTADPAVPILVAGAQAQSLDEAEFAGLAASDCAVASGDSWLAAGSTTTGRTTLLTLSNPTEVAATVDLALYGETGPIAAPGTSGIIVPPDGQRVLSLAGFAPDVQSPVVHVTSRGGQVVANLQQVTTRGLDPGGVDVVGTAPAPALQQVIPGVVMSGLLDQQALQGLEGYDDLAPILRILVPGDVAAKVTVSVVAEDGSSNGTSFQVDVEPGRVTDLGLGQSPDGQIGTEARAGLPDGAYTLRIVSTVPVVAGARISAASGQTNDFAWMAGSTELSIPTLLTVAPGPNPVLHLANASTKDATVLLTGQDGAADVTVVVKAGASASTPVEPGASYLASGFDAMYLAVTVSEPGRIAQYGVRPPGLVSSPITVYP